MERVIIGNGGVARELLGQMPNKNLRRFVTSDAERHPENGVLHLDEFNPATMEAIVAVGDPLARQHLVSLLPKNTKFFSFVHSSAQIFDPEINVPPGSIISANCILTTNISLGLHTYLNRGAMIGHDTTCGDFLSLMPGAVVSGRCKLGSRVNLGNNASVREQTSICSDVIIGMQAAVTRNICEPGVYVGVPAGLMKHSDST